MGSVLEGRVLSSLLSEPCGSVLSEPCGSVPWLIRRFVRLNLLMRPERAGFARHGHATARQNQRSNLDALSKRALLGLALPGGLERPKVCPEARNAPHAHTLMANAAEAPVAAPALSAGTGEL